MEIVNVHQAKTHLSRLLERVQRGEEIVIARNGKPIGKLVPLSQDPRQPGRLEGRIVIGPDFDEPLPESIERPFRGEGR